MTAPVVEVEHLHKRYGGVHALTDMSLAIQPGSVHAVVGENGAGKSTLMKIMAGAEQPDSGEIRVAGRTVELTSPATAASYGIGIVHQELSVFPSRSILANLFLDDLPTRYGVVDTARMRSLAAPVLARMGMDLPVETPLSQLGVGERQLVELSRLLIRRPDVLILDEPNSALNERETSRLFEVLRSLRDQGVAIVYVSHRLEEVFAIADVVTVMRNGRHVTTTPREQTTIAEVVHAMVGLGTEELFPPRPETEAGGEPLIVRQISVGDALSDVSFEVRPGEVVGLGGLEGSGTATVLGAVYGTRRLTGGTISYPDGRGPVRSATSAARRGISLVPADRKRQGLMLDKSVLWNVSQVVVGALRGSWWVSSKQMRAAVERQKAGMNVKVSDPGVAVHGLSGGNQQKVVIGKWLEAGPRVFLLDDPTRGVDVGAKAEIYKLIRRLSATGAVVLFRSSELPELAGLADRILVLYRGRLAGELSGAEATEARLLHAINTGTITEEDT